jgi:hypothetical protein
VKVKLRKEESAMLILDGYSHTRNISFIDSAQRIILPSFFASPVNSAITALGQVLHWPTENTYFTAKKYGLSSEASGTLLTMSMPQNVWKSLPNDADWRNGCERGQSDMSISC